MCNVFIYFWPCVPFTYNLISIKIIQLYAHWFSPNLLFLSCGVQFHFGIHRKYWWSVHTPHIACMDWFISTISIQTHLVSSMIAFSLVNGWMKGHYMFILTSVFFGKILQPSDKKKGMANPTKGFLKFKKKIAHILTQKA